MCFSHYLSVSVVSPCLVKFTVSVVKLTSVLKVQLIAIAGESVRSGCNVVLRGQNCGPRHILSAERL